MTEKKGFWRLMQAGALLLYILILITGYVIHQPKPAWILIGLLALLHISEMRTVLSIGQENALSKGYIILMNMLFGFTWWVPLKKGVIER
jgi:hypothetical protein